MRAGRLASILKPLQSGGLLIGHASLAEWAFGHVASWL